MTAVPRYNDFGQPVLRVTKDLLTIGSYTPPTGAWKLAVDTDRLHTLARRFSAMRIAGVTVPVISADEQGKHNWKPENGRGTVIDMAVSGDRLIGTIELVGANAIELAGRAEVSVGINPDFRDGRGQNYGEAIDHVAICLNPIVPGQQSWRIAASMNGRADDRVYLSMTGSDDDTFTHKGVQLSRGQPFTVVIDGFNRQATLEAYDGTRAFLMTRDSGRRELIGVDPSTLNPATSTCTAGGETGAEYVKRVCRGMY